MNRAAWAAGAEDGGVMLARSRASTSAAVVFGRADHAVPVSTTRSSSHPVGGDVEVVPSWCRRRPSGGRRTQPEHREAGKVVCAGEKAEVGVDLAPAAQACSSSAVFASHQVTELAFDLGAGRSVVLSPLGVLLLMAGVGETLLVATDSDGAAALGVGALLAQRAVSAGVGEVGDPVAVGVAADGDCDTGRARDCVAVEVDGEAVLGEQPACRGGRLGLASASRCRV